MAALCFAREEHWYPKLAAAQRAMDVDEPFSELIRAAVASYETGRRQPGQLSVDAAGEFLAHVLDHLRGLAGVVTPQA